jgi:hypothetical protein
MKLILLILVAIVLVGTMGYEDAVQEESTYCDMVKQGAWPDYKGVCK